MRQRGLDDTLPDTIADAMSSAAEELAQAEHWVPKHRAGLFGYIPRIMSLIVAARSLEKRDGGVSRMVREGSLSILAYLPADLRLTFILDLARRNPAALDDLMTGQVRASIEIYRYNILSSIGIFARHGLVHEMMTRERIDEVNGLVDRVRKRKAQARS